MKAFIRKTIMFAPFLSLAACIETSAPLCNADNKIDVPGFEREYSMAIQLDPTTDVSEQKVSVTRTGRGEYQADGQSISTCQVGNWTLAESATKYGTHQQSILSMGSNGSASFNQLLISPKHLTEAGVEFEIVERQVEEEKSSKIQRKVAKLLGTNDTKMKVMVIKSENPAAREAIGLHSKPSAIGFLAH